MIIHVHTQVSKVCDGTVDDDDDDTESRQAPPTTCPRSPSVEWFSHCLAIWNIWLQSLHHQTHSLSIMRCCHFFGSVPQSQFLPNHFTWHFFPFPSSLSLSLHFFLLQHNSSTCTNVSEIVPPRVPNWIYYENWNYETWARQGVTDFGRRSPFAIMSIWPSLTRYELLSLRRQQGWRKI